MKDHSTENRYDIAAELLVPNEYIEPVKQIDDVIFFRVKGGRDYSAKLTKTGKLKKHSIRIWS